MLRVAILLGPPGAGKGTQAKRLSTAVSLPHVATGDLFRENISKGTVLGREAKSYMEAGQLVPDELVIEMLFDRVSRPDCRSGYLLDGFPRTLNQAESLDSRLDGEALVQVANLEVPAEVLVRRAAGRLLCRNCDHIHHIEFSPPKVEGVCDACGGELYRRMDDEPEVVRERLAVYHEQTRPLVAYYQERGVLENVDGDRTPDDVFMKLRQWVKKAG